MYNDNNILKKLGLKNTQPRNIVYNILKSTKEPLTVEDIYQRTQRYNYIINLSTIYRILDIFLEKGLIVKTFINNENKATYIINNHEHKHYLICVDCKKVVEIDNCPFNEFEKAIENQTDYCITGHKLELFGICPNCKK